MPEVPKAEARAGESLADLMGEQGNPMEMLVKVATTSARMKLGVPETTVGTSSRSWSPRRRARYSRPSS